MVQIQPKTPNHVLDSKGRNINVLCSRPTESHNEEQFVPHPGQACRTCSQMPGGPARRSSNQWHGSIWSYVLTLGGREEPLNLEVDTLGERGRQAEERGWRSPMRKAVIHQHRLSDGGVLLTSSRDVFGWWKEYFEMLSLWGGFTHY